ncbi:MAG: TonB-dependent receptor, partial [Rhodothermales bacterium]|nr:TonB-dependent receptor [Rhodothermales bacterium]
TWRPQNVGRTASVGAEVSASGAFRFWRATGRLFIAYEFVRARDRSDPASQTFGQPLRYVPEHTLRSNLALDVGRLSAGFTMRFVGRRYVTEDASSFLDPYVILDSRIGWRLAPTVDISTIMENVLDTEYQPIAGYPMPGRHLRFQLRLML